MRNPTQNFSSETLNSQTPDASPTQPNTQDPRLTLLTVDELCQSFIDHHCGKPPRPDLARPYLAELLNRQEQAEADKDDAKQNNLYFKALDALATVKSRRRFLQGILAVSLALAAPKPAEAEAEAVPDSDFEQRRPPYPGVERQAVIGRWLAVIDSTLVHIESFWSYLEDCNEMAPAEVDDQRLYHLMNEAHNAANELCSLLESGDSVYNLDELLSVTTGKPLGYIFLREEILRGDMDPDRMQSEINAYAEDFPQYRQELESLLVKAVQNG